MGEGEDRAGQRRIASAARNEFGEKFPERHSEDEFFDERPDQIAEGESSHSSSGQKGSDSPSGSREFIGDEAAQQTQSEIRVQRSPSRESGSRAGGGTATR